MVLALTVLALVGLWWLGRSGWRLPPGLTPRRLAGFALIGFAGLVLLRGGFVLALMLAAGGLYLLEGGGSLLRRLQAGLDRLRAFAAGASARPRHTGRTAMLEPERNADGAPHDALVLAGPRSGWRLSQLDGADLAALLGLCRSGDPEGALFLEAYLDRRMPGWRVDAERDRDAGAGRPLQPGALTEQEAYQILGLQRGASLQEIRAAHRSLMKRLHPDQGGSAEAAARLNAARDRLTNRHR